MAPSTKDAPAVPVSEDTAEIRQRIVEDIKQADSIEALLGGVTDIDLLLEIPLAIERVDWQPTDVGDLGKYAVIFAKDTSGTEYVTTCGGEAVMAQLERADEKGWLPLPCMIRKTTTRAGFEVYRLGKIPAAAATG